MMRGCIKIEDIIIIFSLLAVQGLGFIPVFFFNMFLNRVRRPVIESTRKRSGKPSSGKGSDENPLAEFERLGEVRFTNTEVIGKKKNNGFDKSAK